MGNIQSSRQVAISPRDIEVIESAIWQQCSLSINILETQKQAISTQYLERNLADLENRVAKYIEDLTAKHLTSESYHKLSTILEKILKFANLQKFGYRLMIKLIKDSILFLDDIVASVDGMVVDEILSEDELLTKCYDYCDETLDNYRKELSLAGYPTNQANIRVYNLHKIIYDQVSYYVDSYVLAIIDQIKGATLIEVDQLLCAAIASEVFNGKLALENDTRLNKAVLAIEKFMSLFDDGKDKLLSLPFTMQRRAIDLAIEEISYKIDSVIRQIQIAYSADKFLLQKLTFGINNISRANGKLESYSPPVMMDRADSSTLLAPLLRSTTKKTKRYAGNSPTAEVRSVTSTIVAEVEPDSDNSVSGRPPISRPKKATAVVGDSIAGTEATPRKRRAL